MSSRPETGRHATAVGSPFAWGLGDPDSLEPTAVHDLRLQPGTSVEPAPWFAALAAVLHRYDPHGRPVVDLLPGPHGEPAVPVRCSDGEVGGTDPLGALSRRYTEAERPVHDLVRRHGATFTLPAPDGGAPALTLRPHTDADGEPRLQVRHDPRLLHPTVVHRWTGHLVRAHREAVTAPDTTVDDVRLLDPVEEAAVHALGQGEPLPDRTETSLTAAFDAVAAARPGAIAVGDGVTALTYGELRSAADRLAQGLRAAGVRRGSRVGLCLERGPDLVVAVLAVLKAGGAYVPMDPAYPEERLRYTADDAGLALVVTDHDDFPAPTGVPCVRPRSLADAGAGRPPATGPGAAPEPEDAAYVIYTSGSTGRPKGVVVRHRSVLALIAATRDTYGFGPDDVWTLFHSIAFDFSVWEVWGCLLTGGRLIVVPHVVSRDPEAFRDLLAEERVTVLNQTPSAFAQLAEADRGRSADLTLRLVVFGGEPLDARMLLPWFERHPARTCRMVNMYGITETTVHVTAQTLTPDLAAASTRSVGRPLPGWWIRVVDARGRTLPPGVAGEILVGGAGLAEGYLGRPELTAERFPTDDRSPGGRLYRSGDLGRLRPDGTLDHLGRIDSQVKLRGFRIEPDEIRAVLLEQPHVTAAAVVVRAAGEGGAHGQRLDAYVVLDGGDAETVRRGAARLLPAYMVPATCTALPRLPVTVNGKLDRHALPLPRSGGQDPDRLPGATDPDEVLTDRIRRVWAEVLGLPVGPDDDFYDAGGDSVAAVTILRVLRDQGLAGVSLRLMMRHGTPRALAEALRETAEVPPARR
ncbi:amino acid adenylation domain-containing protein [Streptomyces sp. NPDC017936]|uniref:amino acid adenylation domain-containing protein n=1 Tax=Streptomyces sp. NPDC017936 TaxID=3365016 RepID=UPI00378B10E5